MKRARGMRVVQVDVLPAQLSPEELACMAGLGCSPQEAQAFYQRLIPVLALLAFPFPRSLALVTARPSLNLRERPAREARVIGSLPTATQVEVWGQTAWGDWLLVTDPAGWAWAEYLQQIT